MTSSTTPPHESPTARRKRREAIRHAHVDHLTARLRALTGSGATIGEARALRDRYALAIFGFMPGIGGDAFAAFLLSDEAGEEDAEDIDGRFIALAAAQIDAVAHAAGAIREARLRG